MNPTNPNDPRNSGNSGNPALEAELLKGRRAVAERDRNVIVLTGGLPGDAKTFRFDKDRVVLGSVVSCDVQIAGDGIEPIHAVLEVVPEPKIYDLASETGVFVNGKKVVTQALKNGDEITFGRVKLKFSVESRTRLVTQMSVEQIRWTEGRSLFLSPDEDFKPLLLEEDADDIFDYRPAHQSAALQVVMAWHGTVLNIEHFVREEAVTIGVNEQSHFGIPPLLSSSNHPIVTRFGTDFVLNLDRQMRGVMFKAGSLLNMDDMLASGGKSEYGSQVKLAKEDFAKISIGEVDFFFSFTDAPPKLKRSRLLDRDVLFYKISSASMILTLLTIAGLNSMRVVPTLEAEQIPERLATILYAPEKYARVPVEHVQQPKATDQAKPVEKKLEPVKPPKPQPKPTIKLEIKPNPNNANKPIPKEMDTGAKKDTPVPKQPPKPAAKAPSKAQGAAKEGEGARAQGKEGSRGTKNAAADKMHQNKAQTPSPNGGKGAGSSDSQVADFGNVDFLKGAEGKIENILSGAGANLGKGGDKFKGLGGFDTRGNGGLALEGNGKGGGGTSALSQGLSDKGRGMGRVGTGLGAAGNGNGIIGGEARVAIRSGGPEEAVVMGSIDAGAVEAALLAHKDEFRNCYEREINAENPSLAGRVGTTFVIGGSGRVTSAGIESSSLKNANVERCILNVIKRIDFPIPRGGGVVHVVYPFKYSPVN